METKTESKRLILLIDDDQINLRVLTLLLQHAGYDTMQASDGHEGFQMALEYNPDLVVLDVMMPKMSGIEVAHKLQLESAVPFMFVSSCSEKEIV
ncbi:MAG: response regulator, partial [Burkholderiales bacterium]|nr:response regulator [Burkholderiales bacterium]